MKKPETKDFQCGLAMVKKKDKWGFVNEKGKLVIPCVYNLACDFFEDKALVGKTSELHYINKANEVI